MSSTATATEGLPVWMAQVRSAFTRARFHCSGKYSSFGRKVVDWDLRMIPLGST